MEAKLRKQPTFSAGSWWTGVMSSGTLAECSRETDTHQIVSQAHRVRRKVCLGKKEKRKIHSKSTQSHQVIPMLSRTSLCSDSYSAQLKFGLK